MKVVEGKDNFKLIEGKNEICEITWSVIQSMFIIEHTYVNDSCSRKESVEDLVEIVVNKVCYVGKKIIPLCMSARHRFEVTH